MTARQNLIRNGIPPHRLLPNKETNIFKNLLKEFELKQYKKGLKMCEQILKKHPDHGETLCMKGLFLVHLDRKDEGISTVKLGITKDLTSHICWHVYGLIHRTDKNYSEAMKCYLQALKFDPNNFQILRDLALLQTQLRRYDALVQTRTTLLQFQPKNQSFWLGLVMANEMAGRPAIALKVLQSYEEAVKIPVKPFDHETSEVLMYKNHLIQLTGDYEQALTHLDEVQRRVCDTLAWREQRAYLLYRLGRFEEAEVAYRGLIDLNPDNREYLRTGRSKDIELPENTPERITEACRQLTMVYPRSQQLQLIPLYLAHDTEFRRQTDTYVRQHFTKGVPSLFSTLKQLYTHQPDKVAVVHDVVAAYKDGLAAEEPATVEKPSPYIWALYFLALHYNFLGDHVRALATVEEALARCPSLVELHLAKAKFVKHQGDLAGASAILTRVREMDPSDRFVNNKCTKYLLRHDQTDEAEKTIMQFVRQDVPDKLQEFKELQVLWYQLESGHSFRRQHRYGQALKRYHQVAKDFTEFLDDQFDFHTYSLRKLTMRSYGQILRFEDRLYTRPQYRVAALAAVDIYLLLEDRRVHQAAQNGNAAATPHPNKKKPHKPAVPAATTSTPAAAGSAKDGATGEGEVKVVVDLDPLGESYLEAKSFPAEALKLLQPLVQLGQPDLDVELAQTRVYLAQAKWDLAAQALGR
ncbi:NMDA receptor-regulated protein 1-domain-containing protein, partial [Dimargaris cristalligena]